MAEILKAGLGGLGGSEEASSSEPTLTYRKEIRIDSTTATKTETWTGEYDKLLEKAKEYKFGKVVSDADLFTGGSDTEGVGWSYPTITNVSLSRGRGKIGTLIVLISQWRQEVLVSIDHVEISRPIMTWQHDAEAEDDRPDLVKIAKWKKLEDTAWEDYAAFKVDGKELEGVDKDLAELIYKGVETYTIYAPVVSLTMRTFSPPELTLKPIGSVHDSVNGPYPWKAARDIEIADVVRDCKNPSSNKEWKWIVVSSRSTPSADGSYTWVIQFQGIDDVDSKIYEYASGGNKEL